MFKKYGVLGILLILFAEVNFLLKIEPFATGYFFIVWLGYVLLVDAIVYKIRKHSLIMDEKWKMLWLFVLSAVFWWIFEIANIPVKNWNYQGSYDISLQFFAILRRTVYFSFVLPAFFETYEK